MVKYQITPHYPLFPGQTIQKLAIVSLTAVYNDILPSYTVKPSQELDSLSKEVPYLQVVNI